MQVPTTTSRPAGGDSDEKSPGLRRALVTAPETRGRDLTDPADTR